MVNKIIDKNSVSHDINDARIASLDDVKPSISGTSLVIPTQEETEPIAVIDGVAYFHKHEFNLEELQQGDWNYYDLLTGEVFATIGDESRVKASIEMSQYGPTALPRGGFLNLSSFLEHGDWHSKRFVIAANNYTGDVDYVSRAFTVVASNDDVTDRDNQIVIPGCSAFYGELSADGKTFTSYFNLKSDGATSKIDSIQQGNSKMPIVDDRLPEPTAQDADKVLKVGSTGEYELGEAGGGVKLYKHLLTPPSGVSAQTMIILMTDQNNVWQQTNPFNNVLSIAFYQTTGYLFSCYQSTNIGYATLKIVSYDIANSQTVETMITNQWTDTVTEL